MRRWPTLTVGLVFVVGAACSGQDDVDGSGDTGVETAAPAADLADAVSVAQRTMPVAVPDSRVGILLEDLCAGAAPDLAALALADEVALEAAVGALEAASDGLCPGEVDPAQLAAARRDTPLAASAATPTAGTAAPAPSAGTAAAGGTSSAERPASASSGASAATSGSGGAANTSTGAASTSGGNATGTGNSSSTDFTQGVGSSSNQSSSGSGASNSAAVGSP